MGSESSEYSIYRRVVSQLMNGEEQLPSLPMLTLDIRRALANDAVQVPALVRLVGRDPALSALLMKHASCAIYRHPVPPKTLQDVINLLGMREVDRITMVHSIKSLFTLHSPAHKRLFMEVWQRLTLKASTCAMLARLLGHVAPEHALLASLLSEVGTLAVLSAFRDEAAIPSGELYYKLCREYSKSLGVIVLKKWSVDDEYIEVIRNTGNWAYHALRELELIDLVNLALYHSVKERNADADLPPLYELAAYHKLLPPLNFIAAQGELELVVKHRADIHAIAATLR
ncbi:HDOD domain-containing protein [Pseudomonas sp. UL070]|uniref:HDOD domain-containing protein n=1 Tax=Aquipseudomonas ullengensis TaxID=2759166 RepID=A0A7W4Q903_9GAMM|nr:HDOD domain-containing protein [Pseudomonas ullengensis]